MAEWIHTFNLPKFISQTDAEVDDDLCAKPDAVLCDVIVDAIDRYSGGGQDFEKAHREIMRAMRKKEEVFGPGWHCTIRFRKSEHAQPLEYQEALCGGHLQYMGTAVCIFQERPRTRILTVSIQVAEEDQLQVSCTDVS